MLSVKLTKIVSTHENLRTNEVIGFVPDVPTLGERLVLVGESLTPGKDGRMISTSPVKSVSYDSTKKVFTFKTENSIYELEVLDKYLTDQDIMEHRTIDD